MYSRRGSITVSGELLGEIRDAAGPRNEAGVKHPRPHRLLVRDHHSAMHHEILADRVPRHSGSGDFEAPRRRMISASLFGQRR